jgi:hypothetical protein
MRFSHCHGDFFKGKFGLTLQDVLSSDDLIHEHFQTIRHIRAKVIFFCEACEFSDDALTTLDIGGLLMGKFTEEG